MKEMLMETNYVEELITLFREYLSGHSAKEELLEELSAYHDNDIAGALEQLNKEERKKLYPVLGAERVSDIFAYIENPDKYMAELQPEAAARVLSRMDADDAVDVLEEMDEAARKQVVALLDKEAGEDIRLIWSYEPDEIGSLMTTNFIEIKKNLTIKQATHELIRQAGDNDNIGTIYVTDERDDYYGAIDLKDLIVARDGTELEELISTSYPFVNDREIIGDCIERIRDYQEDSIPVVSSEGKILGVITSQDIVEAVDDEMGDDYAKLAGLTAEEDLQEKTLQSMKKRLPWLIILLFLGLGVSSVVGVFETVVAVLPIVICFQSLILDMAGNVGTQSLAVTIRVLMDENLSAAQKFGLVIKEMRVGFGNGCCLGILSLVFIGLYLFTLKHYPLQSALLISACVGISLLVAMVISSLVGTLIPMLFHKLKIDPAVASGPLITTVNDFVAVITYYGLAWIFLLKVFRLA